MEEKIAKILSVLFHPMLIPTYALLLLFSLNSYIAFCITFAGKMTILGLIFSITFLMPVMFFLILKRRGLIQSVQMESKQERIFPFLITAIFYYAAYFMLKKLELPPVYYLVILGAALLVIVCLIINLWWKISIHLTSIGGILGAFIGISITMNIEMNLIICALVLVSGLLGASRLILKAHTQAQVYVGFLSGFISMLLLFSL